MNLIEQLGGYERAKEIAFDPLHPQMTHVSNDGRHWVNENFSYIPEIQSQIPKMARIDDIRKALLEYRRQHNIFEVGDKVVYVDDFMPNSVSVVSEVNDRVWLNDNNAVCIKEMIKHAEDEEIKAGKRLGVKSEN